VRSISDGGWQALSPGWTLAFAALFLVLIAETGREPVERDSIYRKVKREGVKWSVDAEK